jgi:hypothetical protein
MDKSTLSNYGWIVIVVLVLAVMLALATPFGSFVADGVSGTVTSFTQTIGDSLGFETDTLTSGGIISTPTTPEYNYYILPSGEALTNGNSALEQELKDYLLIEIPTSEFTCSPNEDSVACTFILQGGTEAGVNLTKDGEDMDTSRMEYNNIKYADASLDKNAETIIVTFNFADGTQRNLTLTAMEEDGLSGWMYQTEALTVIIAKDLYCVLGSDGDVSEMIPDEENFVMAYYYAGGVEITSVSFAGKTLQYKVDPSDGVESGLYMLYPEYRDSKEVLYFGYNMTADKNGNFTVTPGTSSLYYRVKGNNETSGLSGVISIRVLGVEKEFDIASKERDAFFTYCGSTVDIANSNEVANISKLTFTHYDGTEDEIQVKNGKLLSDDYYIEAGKFNDSMLLITIEAPKVTTIKYITVEQYVGTKPVRIVFSVVDANTLMTTDYDYMIGGNTRMDVNATFSQGQKVVTIEKTKNSTSGNMLNFGTTSIEFIGTSSSSPMSQRQEYLETAIIKDGILNIGTQAFKDCKKLTSVTIPDSVTYIGKEAFKNCTNLTSIHISKNIEYIGEMAFYNCPNLEITIDPENEHYVMIDGVLYTKDQTRLLSYNSTSGATTFEVPDTVTKIDPYAFGNVTSLTSIELPNSLIEIGERAFQNCSKLQSIEIPEGTTKIGKYAFANCTAMTSVKIPTTLKVSEDSAFDNCTKLNTVYIEDVKSWCNIDFQSGYDSNPLFYGQRLIVDGELVTHIDIPNGVKSIPACAFSCKNIQTVTIPASVKTIGFRAFYSSGLTSIIIPDTVTTIEYGAFFDCDYLNSFALGKGIPEIKEMLLYGCGTVQEVIIPETVTSIYNAIFDSTTVKVIKGKSGSYAETWANKKGYTFVAI